MLSFELTALRCTVYFCLLSLFLPTPSGHPQCPVFGSPRRGLCHPGHPRKGNRDGTVWSVVCWVVPGLFTSATRHKTQVCPRKIIITIRRNRSHGLDNSRRSVTIIPTTMPARPSPSQGRAFDCLISARLLLASSSHVRTPNSTSTDSL